ncbi:MAG: GTPase CgtA [Methanosaeta sp. PtaB.Bin039]|nr:MAG: GTPase CgtA [Methanosaeta sp. PtaB.Bin039]HOT07447.1 50S ribosome-binding GTPase [Methanotrichaceae archaeon]HQF17406.1 50S ribosome-binding GTPase [Methanotrichaceae archaeon]HQI91168.1 50S ribosome-binding GTPase [Methanotrichaceae archaeon]HQJ29237.1 50S ribosome-binding GTPase [Methanotrichaceae archaeon]
MFERLPPIPSSQDLIDRAFRRGARAGQADRDLNSTVRTAGSILSDNLAQTVRKFPSFEGLPPFYRDLAEAVVGVDQMRIHLSRVSWAAKQIRKVAKESSRSRAGPRGALGRMASVMRSIDKDLEFLDDASRKLRHLPGIDPTKPTLIVAGYPNVGKSSFLVRVTGARPEIASYPFTTQGLVVGHLEHKGTRVQVVDTPGLLDRPMAQRNRIELQAVTALSHLPGAIIFILDPSEHSGFPVADQLRLLEEIRSSFPQPVVLAANKADLVSYDAALQMSTLSGKGVKEALDAALGLLDLP